MKILCISSSKKSQQQRHDYSIVVVIMVVPVVVLARMGTGYSSWHRAKRVPSSLCGLLEELGGFRVRRLDPRFVELGVYTQERTTKPCIAQVTSCQKPSRNRKCGNDGKSLLMVIAQASWKPFFVPFYEPRVPNTP